MLNLQQSNGGNMKYQSYRMIFPVGIHLGNKLSDESMFTVLADTLFSALCQEAVKNGSLDELVSAVKDNKLLISDAMPFIGDTYYIPKPLVKIQTESQGNSKLKKAFKKLSYISSDKLEVYLKGQLDAEKENEKFSNLGVSTVRTSVAVSNLDKPSPYRVGVFNFNEGNGLYVIVGYEDDNLLYLVSDLLESLSFSGLGGHRSSGLGRFEYKFVKEEFIQTILKRLNDNSKVKTSLSVALPTEEELPTVIENSRYKMLKRSGFVASTTYIKEEDKKDNSMLYFRKNDLYVFSAGSTFTKDFLGDVYDVSNNGRHLVYRYAKPMLMGVDL
jgi:hypothetical protein